MERWKAERIVENLPLGKKSPLPVEFVIPSMIFATKNTPPSRSCIDYNLVILQHRILETQTSSLFVINILFSDWTILFLGECPILPTEFTCLNGIAGSISPTL